MFQMVMMMFNEVNRPKLFCVALPSTVVPASNNPDDVQGAAPLQLKYYYTGTVMHKICPSFQV
jgi:hypothetical protein